jgi:hypothetical protein
MALTLGGGRDPFRGRRLGAPSSLAEVAASTISGQSGLLEPLLGGLGRSDRPLGRCLEARGQVEEVARASRVVGRAGAEASWLQRRWIWGRWMWRRRTHGRAKYDLLGTVLLAEGEASGTFVFNPSKQKSHFWYTKAVLETEGGSSGWSRVSVTYRSGMTRGQARSCIWGKLLERKLWGLGPELWGGSTARPVIALDRLRSTGAGRVVRRLRGP